MVALKYLLRLSLAIIMLGHITGPTSVMASDLQDGKIEYRVQYGDHLYSIALRFRSTVLNIQSANGLTSTVIHPGQLLLIPSVSTQQHIVVAGETLTRIALAYGTTVAHLTMANGLASSWIYPGQILALPTKSIPVRDTLTQMTENLVTVIPDLHGYTVLPGDNLFRISLRFGTTVGALQAANGLYSTLIFPGLSLKIPSSVSLMRPQTHLVQPQNIPESSATIKFDLGGQVTRYEFAKSVTRMKDAGMTWVKFLVPWSPSHNASHRAHLINQAHDNNLSVLLSIRGSPEHARQTYHSDFASFAADIAKLGADAIEVWNEPNLPREWETGHISPISYTELLRVSYRAIKDANPDTMVISAGPAPTGYYEGCSPEGCDDLPFINQIVSAGALNYADCVGVHYNEGLVSPTESYGDPRKNGGHYTRYYQTMVDTYWTAIDGQRPLCFTDLGYLSGQEWGYLPQAYLWYPPYNLTTEQHARYLAEAARLSRDQGKVRLMIVFNVNLPGFEEDPMAGYSIVRPSGQCPACDALAAVINE